MFQSVGSIMILSGLALKNTGNTVGDSYVLKTGEAGARRLELLDRVYGPETRRVLSQIGIPRGGRAADIACGTGTTTAWLAKAVGPDGDVTAVDISVDQLKLATQ